MPAQEQKSDDTPSPISQGVQIWGEGPEIVPFAENFVPPAAFLPPSIANGGGGNGNGSATGTSTSSQIPDTYDLEWVASDTTDFDFFFDGVCWTVADPGLASNRPDGITWLCTYWESQVRSQNNWYYGYWWPPVWPGYAPVILIFTITAEFVEDFNNLGAGTLVHLTGGTLWPGKFVWDLQTTQYVDPLDTANGTVRTWLSGKATIHPQVTQQDLYPPSHWPVYQMAWK